MKQVVLREGRAEVVEVPPPRAGRGAVLVRTTWSVISTGTERANLQSTGESALDKARRRPDLAMQVVQSALRDGIGATLARVRSKLESDVATGYSCAGIIEAVGEGIDDLRVGQRVACAGSECAWHAEFVAVPRNLVCAVPEGVRESDAASAAVGAIALQGVRQAELEIGHVVVVSGLGLVGMLTVQLARAAGAVVVAADPVAGRRDMALALGARAAAPPEDVAAMVRELTGGLGADRTIIAAATSSDQPIRDAMAFTRKRGAVVVVGDVGLSLTRSPFYEKEIEVRISCSYGPGRYDATYEQQGHDYPAAYVRWTENRNMQSYLELLRSGAVRWDALVETELPLDRADEAFRLIAGASSPLAIALRYDAAPAAPAVPAPAPPAVPARTAPARGSVVRLGLLGAGAFTRAVHVPNLRGMQDRFQVTGVATRTGVSARNAAREAGASFITTDYRELLQRSDVDAVLIATRHDRHAEMAVAALEAGKAVFLEKPLALDTTQLDAVLAAVTATGLPFQVGFNRRFSSAAAFLKARIAAHQGAPIVVYRVNADPGTGADWTHGEEGGGRVVGEACHMVDLLHFLAAGPLASVQAMAGSAGRPDANFSAQLRFADGTLATLIYTTQGHKQLPKERIEVYLGGEVGVVDDFRRARSHRAGLLSGRPVGVNKGLREEWEAFHRAVTEGPPLPIDAATLRSVTEATFAIRDQVRG